MGSQHREPQSDIDAVCPDRSWRNATYNASEYQAWRSGQSLMQYLASLRAPGEQTHLLAHSMGNIVAAEALRSWVAQGHEVPLVNTYVAMQGSLSAGGYGSDDTGANPGTPATDLYRHWPTGAGDAENDYYMKGTESAAAKWINLYNPVDAATSGEKRLLEIYPGWGFRSTWPLNNWLRSPSEKFFPYGRSTVWKHDYRSSAGGGFERGRWKSVFAGIGPNYVFVPDTDLSAGLVLPEPVNGRLQPGPSAYETMAFLSRSKAMPIGTMAMNPDETPFKTNIDIKDLGLSDPNLREWPGHSFQFNFDAATTDAFWRRIVTLMAQEGA